MYSYKTVKKESSAEFTEKKSVFTGRVKPVCSEAEALDFINKIRAEQQNASHNAYAYIIRENNITRFSDDGEPSGTAGMPILNVLQKQELTNAAAVVTRYFGGIMLGAGGLVRAYSRAARLGMESAGIAVFENFTEFDVLCSYSDYEKILKYIKSEKIIEDNTQFEADITVSLAVLHDNFEKISKEITDLTNAKAVINKKSERYDFF
ncbi:MAG: YigZ family protein [Oscillospiraceae bacterium]|nr:YigZ family protein [Oscillospiraceae bacterium]